jgi:hypothetical protein
MPTPAEESFTEKSIKNEADAIAMLSVIKRRLGRGYKRAIRNAWYDGNYRGEGLEDWSGNLQKIRNAFGPSWLDRQHPTTPEGD